MCSECSVLNNRGACLFSFIRGKIDFLGFGRSSRGAQPIPSLSRRTPLWNFKPFCLCLCGHVCSLWRAQINSLVTRAAQMVSRVRTGATGTRPSSSWHTPRRLLDAANLATLLTVAHTPPLRIKGIQTPSVLRDTSQATSPPPQPSPLLHLIDFHQGPIFLAPFPAAHLFWQTTRSSWWPPNPNYNPYETLSTTLRKRQTTHTIASQSSSRDAIYSLPLVRNTSSTDSGVVLNPRRLRIFPNSSFRTKGVSWALNEVWSTLQTGFIAWIHSIYQKARGFCFKLQILKWGSALSFKFEEFKCVFWLCKVTFAQQHEPEDGTESQQCCT